jgi:hypothetical protein
MNGRGSFPCCSSGTECTCTSGRQSRRDSKHSSWGCGLGLEDGQPPSSFALQLLKSTRLLFSLCSSLDAARSEATKQNAGGVNALLNSAVHLAARARAELSLVPGIQVLSCSGMESLRVAIHTTGLGLSGYDTDEALVEEFSVIAELPWQSGLVFAVGPGSTEEHVNRLVGAFSSLSRTADGVKTELEGQAKGLAGRSTGVYGEARMTPREAFFSDSERVRTSCTLVRCPSWK